MPPGTYTLMQRIAKDLFPLLFFSFAYLSTIQPTSHSHCCPPCPPHHNTFSPRQTSSAYSSHTSTGIPGHYRFACAKPSARPSPRHYTNAWI